MLRYALSGALATLALGLVFNRPAVAQTAGLGVHPPRLELEMQPGTQKTVSFEVEAPPSDQPVRGRLLISLTDWNLTRNGSMEFFASGSHPGSAAPWIT